MAYRIVVGAYSSVITTLLFNSTSTPASLSIQSSSQAGNSPSWVAPHPTNTSIVFANQENYYGQVISFLIDASGGATQLATAYSGGQNPAYLAVIDNGATIFVPNYNSGQVESIPITNNGATFGSPSAVLQLTGSGPNIQRQASSHPHEAVQNGNEVLVPDLGADKVWRLTKNGNAWEVGGFVQHPAGSGPRHIVVAGSNLYTVHELSNTLTQHTLPPLSSGVQPQLVATLPIIPAGASNTTLAAAELLLSPSSSAFPTQYLYASNRGDTNAEGDTIAIFSLNPLALVKQVRTGLQGLRGVQIGGSNGKYLVAGGQDGGGIKVFERVNGGTDLQELASVQGVNSPTSLAFLG